MLDRKIMVAVAVPQQRVTFFGHIRRRMGQCLHQAHANHIRGSLVTGFLASHIEHGGLDAAGNDGGGVKQGAIPVKGDQVKTSRSHVKKSG